MIGQTLQEYVFVRLSILALRLVMPLSFIYFAVSWNTGTFLSSPILGVYTTLETLFFLVVYLPRRSRLQRDAEHPPLMSPAERDKLFHKCANSMTSESITGWFLRIPGGRILRDNVTDWLLWGLFSARSTEVLEEWGEELDYYVSAMSKLVGYPIGLGSNPKMQCLRLTLDPVQMVHRPLIWYMIVCLLDTLTSIFLYLQGFTHYNTRVWFHAFPPRPLLAFFSQPSWDTVTNIPYWYRPHRSRTKHPILFLHGIGLGVTAFTPLLRGLVAQDPDVGILAIEILPISMHITAPPLARDAMCAAITRILNAHGLHRVVVVAHSYGTVLAAHLLRRQLGTAAAPPSAEPPEENHTNGRATSDAKGSDATIAATLLIDPVTFLLHYPAVAYNFVYRQPRHADEWLMWYFASRDPDISRTLSRHLFWFESILFREDVMGAGRDGRKKPYVAVSLAGRDRIVDAPAVRAYLTGEKEQDSGSPSRWGCDGLEVLYFPELYHGSVLECRALRSALLEVISRFVQPD